MNNSTSISLGYRSNVNPKDILFIRADSNYTHVYLEGGRTIVAAITLGSLAKRLSQYQFIRPNRSVLVNLNYTFGFEDSKSHIRMFNNEIVPVSRRRVKQLKESIG